MYCGTVNVFAAECLYRVNINKRSLKVIDVGDAMYRLYGGRRKGWGWG